MNRLIHTIGLAAAAIVLAVGLWEGWGFLATGKRMIVAYMAFFFLTGLLALAMRLVPLFEATVPKPASARRENKNED